MDALYAEAEQVFLRSLELRYQYELRGDFGEFPDELSDVLADPYLSWVREMYEFYKEKNWHGPEDIEPAVIVRPYPGVSREGSKIALQACMDTRPVPMMDADGAVVSDGTLGYLELYFKQFDGQLKLFYGTTSEVDQCPLV